MSEHAHILNMVLTGLRRGQNIVINGHAFRRGVARVIASPQSLDAFLTLMARSYQIYPEGSAALAAADERDRANGLLRDFQNDSASSDGAPAPVQGAGDNDSGTVPDPRALRGDGHAEGEAGSSGMVSGGPGHEDAGLGQGVESGSERQSDAVMRAIRHTLESLDFRADSQWTEDGLPSVDYVAGSVNDQSVTREMVSAVYPGFNRQQAEDLAAF